MMETKVELQFQVFIKSFHILNESRSAVRENSMRRRRKERSSANNSFFSMNLEVESNENVWYLTLICSVFHLFLSLCVLNNMKNVKNLFEHTLHIQFN